MLRNYQSECVNKILELFIDYNKVLLPMPTRTGKTEVAIEIARHFINKGKRVCFMAHLHQLTDNLSQRLSKYNLDHYMVQGTALMKGYDCYIASKPTLQRRCKVAVNESWFEGIDLYIVDEAHIGILQTKEIIKYSPNAKVLSLTATPYTLTGQGLSDIADTVVPCISEYESRHEGWKVKCKYYSIPFKHKVKVTAGDYNNKELHEAMQKQNLMENPVKQWQLFGEDSTTIVYCVNIEHAHQTATSFRKAGYPCAVINSEKEDYTCLNEYGEESGVDEVLSRFRGGEFKIIVNVGMLTIGYDLPEIRCVVINLATKSLNKWRQMDRASGVNCKVSDEMGVDGRLSAIAQSRKPYCIVIDLGGNLYEHGSHEYDVPFSLRGVEEKMRKCKACKESVIFLRKEKGFKVCPNCNEKEETISAEESLEKAKKEKAEQKIKGIVELVENDFTKIPKWLYKEWDDLNESQREMYAYLSDAAIKVFFDAQRKKSNKTKDGFFHVLKSKRTNFKNRIELNNLIKKKPTIDTLQEFVKKIPVPTYNSIKAHEHKSSVAALQGVKDLPILEQSIRKFFNL